MTSTDIAPAPRRRGLAVRLALPSLAAAGIVGALGLLRHRFERSKLFVPDRYPNGVWRPNGFGLPAEDVWFRTEDGIDLHGWWIPHPDAVGTVLYCHGNSGSIAHQVAVFLHMRRLRVNVLGFDYRGYGRNEGRPSEKGLYADARAAWDHLVGALGVDPATILLFGHSLGGAVAIDVARERRVAGLIVQSTFTHLRDATRAAFPSLPVHLLAGRGFRSLEKVRHLTLPKLFIHGSADSTLPLELGERLFAAAAEPKQLLIVPGAGHNDVYLRGGHGYLRALAAFARRCFAA